MANDDDDEHASVFGLDEPEDAHQPAPDDDDEYRMEPLTTDDIEASTRLSAAAPRPPRNIDISDLERDEQAEAARPPLTPSADGSFAPGTFAATGSPKPNPATDSTPATNGKPADASTATAVADAPKPRPTVDLDIDAIGRQTLADRAGLLTEPDRDTAYLSFLPLLSDSEREKVVRFAYEMGLDRKDPAWLNAWGDARAAIHVNAVLAKVVKILDEKLAQVDERIAELQKPQQYIVHADAGTVNDDMITLKAMMTGMKEQIEVLPFRSVTDVHRMTDPFVKLAEASTGLIRGIDVMRNSTTAAIEEAVENANEMLLRTAFEKHALPADVNKKYHVTTIWLVGAAIVVGIAIFLQPFILRGAGIH